MGAAIPFEISIFSFVYLSMVPSISDNILVQYVLPVTVCYINNSPRFYKFCFMIKEVLTVFGVGMIERIK